MCYNISIQITYILSGEFYMNRLLLIEGIPGSGKTTFAKLLAQKLEEDKKVNLYIEGDLHPADMAWCALLTDDEYNRLCTNYPMHKQAFESNKSLWNDFIIIAYTKIENLEQQLFDYFESKEIYNGRVGADIFCGIHLDRWKKFGEQAEDINIFECALLQNSINELMLFECLEENQISKYIKSLCECVKALNPIVIYIDIDVKTALRRAAAERIDENGQMVWQESVAHYIENSPYGIKNNLKGVEGMEEYFERRMLFEKRILESLPVEKYLVHMDIDKQVETTSMFIEQLCGNL